MSKSVSDILHTRSSSSKDIAELKQQFKDLQRNSTSRSKYNSTSELKASGLSSQYNELRKKLVNIESYSAVVNTANIRNNAELQALIGIKNALIELNVNVANPSRRFTIPQAADIALKKVQDFLNVKLTGNERIFGGINTKTDPCGDLIANTNIISDKATTNYTRSSPNIKTINLSANHSIVQNLSAGHRVFADVIGVMNRIKVLPSNDLSPAQPFITDAVAGMEGLILQSGEKQNTIDEARDYNDIQKVRAADENSEIFAKDEIVVHNELTDSARALQASYSFQTRATKLDEDLLRTLTR